jgi:hypothetical protein
MFAGKSVMFHHLPAGIKESGFKDIRLVRKGAAIKHYLIKK